MTDEIPFHPRPLNLNSMVMASDPPSAALDPRPLWPQDAYKGKGRNRTTTREDTIAFNKRVAKRRKKKGYR